MALNSGTLSGAGNVAVSGLFNWSNGTLAGSGALDANGGIQLTDGSSKYLDERALNNAGTATWSDGLVIVSNGGSFTNTATGTFDDQTDGIFGGNGVDCPTFNNEGLFLKSGGNGTTYLEMDLFNSGTVEIDQGILDVSCGYVQTGGSTVASGGSLIGPVSVQGGDIQGNVSAEVTNSGQQTVVPSPNPTIVTSFIQTATGTLNEQIGGTAPGTGYGQIDVTGNVSLAGSLVVHVINGFMPNLGDQFTIINNEGTNAVSGTFTGLAEGATVTDNVGDLYRISYVGGDGNDVTLTVISTTTTTIVATDHPGGSTYGQTVAFTATVSANAAGAATPTGTVQFVVDGANYGAAETLAGGTASLSLSSLSAGSHTIVAQYTSSSPAFLNSASDPNFSVSVAPAHLTVTADNKSMVYGGSQPALTYQIAGFVSGETLATSGVTGAPSLATVSANSHVGTYVIRVAIGTLAAANYDFPAADLARVQDAISGWNALLVAYSVSVVQVSDPSLANIVINTSTISASGDAGDGVLGCYNSAANEVTLLAGWNWYAGADPSQIGGDQYDFQTTVTHEIGHALGLGGASDPNSPMYESLGAGVAHRTMTVSDLNIPEPPEGADPQMAAGFADADSAGGLQKPFDVRDNASGVRRLAVLDTIARPVAGPEQSSTSLDVVVLPVAIGQDADDVLQEVFQAVATGLDAFRRERPGDTFRGWLHGITRNKLLDYYRRRERHPEAQGGTEAHLQIQRLADQPLPDETDETAEELSDLYHRALEMVKCEFEQGTWEAFWRAAVEDQSPAVIAADLGVTPAAVRKAKSRVLHRLREELGEFKSAH